MTEFENKLILRFDRIIQLLESFSGNEQAWIDLKKGELELKKDKYIEALK